MYRQNICFADTQSSKFGLEKEGIPVSHLLGSPMIIDYLSRMPRFFLCTLSLLYFSTLTAFGQKKLFVDDFSSNKHGWRTRQNSGFLVDIKNGALHLEKFEKNFTDRACLWYSKTIPGFNTLDDFSITFYAKYLSGGDILEQIDFQWGKPLEGKLEVNHLYQLTFLLKGEVKLDYYNNEWNYFVRKNIKASLGKEFNPKQVNKYTITQKDSFLIFSINDKEVLQQLYAPVKGNSIGFQQCLKTAWEIDKIVVRQQPNKKKPSAPAADSSYVIKRAKITHPADTELRVFPNPFNHDLLVSIQLDKEERIQLSLIDMSGNILQQHNKQLPAGIQHIRLYADVPPGSYILKMQVGTRVLAATVVRQ